MYTLNDRRLDPVLAAIRGDRAVERLDDVCKDDWDIEFAGKLTQWIPAMGEKGIPKTHHVILKLMPRNTITHDRGVRKNIDGYLLIFERSHADYHSQGFSGNPNLCRATIIPSILSWEIETVAPGQIRVTTAMTDVEGLQEITQSLNQWQQARVNRLYRELGIEPPAPPPAEEKPKKRGRKHALSPPAPPVEPERQQPDPYQQMLHAPEPPDHRHWGWDAVFAWENHQQVKWDTARLADHQGCTKRTVYNRRSEYNKRQRSGR